MRLLSVLALPLLFATAGCDEELMPIESDGYTDRQERVSWSSDRAGAADDADAEPVDELDTCGCPAEVVGPRDKIVVDECAKWTGNEPPYCIDYACQVQHADGALAWYTCR